MIKSLYTGISGMKANQQKMDVIGNNVANVGTTAFKKSNIRFADALNQTYTISTGPSMNFGGINAKQIGLGVKVTSVTRNCSQGSLQVTGRSTDLGIDGDGYFIVGKGPDENGIIDVSYTRDGSFNLDRDSALVTNEGYRVLGRQLDDKGNVVGDLVPIQIPREVNGVKVVAFNISINGNGVITATLEDGTKIDVALLEVAKFANPEGLEALNGNRFIPSANSGDAVFLSEGASKAFGWVNQGALEMSNVDLSEEFTEMIVTSRAFQAVGKVVSTSDELLQEIMNLKR